MAWMQEYFELDKQYRDLYGKRTIIFAEVGSFYEAMSNQDDGGVLKEACNILNIVFTRKSKADPFHPTCNPWLAGFPSGGIERQGRILVENGYSVVIVDQIPLGKGKFDRKVSQVLSPGTCISNEADQEPNVVAIMWSKETTRRVVEGFLWRAAAVSVNTYTGKTVWMETFSTWQDPHKARDDLTAFIDAFPPKEILFGGIDRPDFISAWCSLIGIPETTPSHEMELNMFRDATQRQELWVKVYLSKGVFPGLLAFERDLGFWGDDNASATLACLIRFLWQHHETLVRQIPRPERWSVGTSDGLVLEATAASQLQIEHVFQMLNRGLGPLGKRLLHYRLTAPTTSATQLSSDYDKIDVWLQKSSDDRQKARELIDHLGDWERIHRKIAMRKATPCDLSRLITGLQSLCNSVNVNAKTIATAKLPNIPEIVPQYISFIEKILQKEGIDLCVGNVLEPAMFVESFKSEQTVGAETTCKKLNRWLDVLDSNLRSVCGQESWFRLEDSDRDGRNWVITQKRWNTLEASARNVNIEKIGLCREMESDLGFKIDNSSLVWTAVAGTGTSVKVSCQVSKKLVDMLRDAMIMLQEGLAGDLMRCMENIDTYWSSSLPILHKWLASSDLSLQAAVLANANRYCRPELVSESTEGSFVEAEGLRHLLVERRNDDKVAYVSNDVSLGLDTSAVVLYGVNACGKSTLGRAIGISVVLAQAGLFVPAAKFRLRPFQRILCRILGNDDPLRGLSSFAVEVSEIRSILHRADNKSLVIMDEPCRGTEAASALALVASCIHSLYDAGARMWIATHLHGLVDQPEVYEKEQLRFCHLSVTQDETGGLMYDRRLRSGVGPTSYGILVAKAMNLPKEVVEMAERIRKRNENISEDPRGKQSRYNRRVWLSSCEICGRKAEHVHHIKEQHTADSDGYVSDLIKVNDKSNLLPLCAQCHDDVHREKIEIRGWKQTSCGVVLDYCNSASGI